MVMSMTVDGPHLVQQAGVHFSLTPTGRTIVYSGMYGGSRVLFRRDLDRLDPEPIVGTAGGSDAFFSDDGRRIGFETRSELWSTSLDDGTPHLLHVQPSAAWWNLGRRRPDRRRSCGFRPVDDVRGRRRVSSVDDPGRRRASRTSPTVARWSRRALHNPGREEAASRSRCPARHGRSARCLRRVSALATSTRVMWCSADRTSSGPSVSISTRFRHGESRAASVRTSSGRPRAIRSSRLAETRSHTYGRVRRPRMSARAS